jgi:hypothetical protein
MQTVRVLLLVSCFSIAFFGAALSELTTVHFDSDAEMLQYLSDTVFVSEGRIGDRGGTATFELDLGQSTGSPVQTADYDWQNGVPEPFTLVYDSADSLVTFSLGGVTLYYNTLYQDFDAVFVRTRAVDGGAAMVVDDLMLNGEVVNDQSSTAGPNGLDILLIYGVPIGDGFTLEGVATLSWTGAPPTQSRLAFQIKVARSAVIQTEPASWGDIKKRQR